MNRYAFAGGNPISNVELDGHMYMIAAGGGGGSTDNSSQKTGISVSGKITYRTDQLSTPPLFNTWGKPKFKMVGEVQAEFKLSGVFKNISIVNGKELEATLPSGDKISIDSKGNMRLSVLGYKQTYTGINGIKGELTAETPMPPEILKGGYIVIQKFNDSKSIPVKDYGEVKVTRSVLVGVKKSSYKEELGAVSFLNKFSLNKYPAKFKTPFGKVRIGAKDIPSVLQGLRGRVNSKLRSRVPGGIRLRLP